MNEEINKLIEKKEQRERHSEIIKETVLFFGNKSQRLHSIQELSELILALTKDEESGTSDTRENVLEELVDVQIMMNQLIRIYNFTQAELEEMQIKKMLKLESFLAESKKNQVVMNWR